MRNNIDLTDRHYQVLAYLIENEETRNYDEGPKMLTFNQYLAALEDLESMHLIKVAYVEGRKAFDDIKVFPAGKAAYDDYQSNIIYQPEEMNSTTYITSLSLKGDTLRCTHWNNQVEAKIIDLEGNGEFHLVDYPNGKVNPKLWGDINELRNSQVLASGLIGAWLRQCAKEESTNVDLNKVFAAYSAMCRDRYVRFVDSSPEFFGIIEAERLFYMSAHLLQEEEKFAASTAIYPFLSADDITDIETVKEKYKKFIHDKYRELYPPKLETFLSYFDGKLSIGYKCVRLYLQERDKDNVHGPKYPSNMPYYAVEEKGQILTECNCVDFSILRGRNNAIIEEIKTGLEQKLQQEDRLRYIHNILFRLQDFCSLVYPINEIDLSRKLIGTWKDRIEKGYEKDNCMIFIKKNEKDISIMQVRSEGLFSMPEYGQTESKEVHYQILDEEDYARKFMALYLNFVRRFDSLLMYYDIDLLEIENEQAIYLCPPQDWPSLGGDEFYLTIAAAQNYYKKLPKREENKRAIEARYSGEPMPVLLSQEADPDIPTEHTYEITEEDWVKRYNIEVISRFTDLDHLIAHISKLRKLYEEELKNTRFYRTRFLRNNLFHPLKGWLSAPADKISARAVRELFNDDKFSDKIVSDAKIPENPQKKTGKKQVRK